MRELKISDTVNDMLPHLDLRQLVQALGVFQQNLMNPAARKRVADLVQRPAPLTPPHTPCTSLLLSPRPSSHLSPRPSPQVQQGLLGEMELVEGSVAMRFDLAALSHFRRYYDFQTVLNLPDQP